MKLPPEHPQRLELNDEVHARPPEALSAPLRVTYLALFTEGEARGQCWSCVQALATRFGATPPHADARHFSADLGDFRVKCERHAEFMRFKFIVSGSDTGDPFAEPAIGAVPADWLATVPGLLIVAANVALLEAVDPPPDFDQMAAQYFNGNTLVGASVAAGAGIAVTDFRVHADGFSRVLVIDKSMTPRQAGRMVQRLMEIDTYRILALMTLPVARALAPALGRGERELAGITRALADAQAVDEALLFDRLSRLEAEIESQQSQNLFRFSAADAYDTLVQRRIGELREERIAGLQTFQEFTERRLGPAMSTCRSVAARQDSLSQRLARVTQLLSTRVDITREGQTQRVLESMNRRAKLQLRLQETVEGLSVAAITYYVVGLVGYAAKGAKAAGLPIEVELVMALAIPVAAVLIALGLRRMRRLVSREG